MSTVLINGVTGQDGTYLAELLIEDGFHVVGIVRDSKNIQTRLPDTLAEKIEIVEWDMFDENRLRDILTSCEPVAFFNLAAYSIGSEMFENASKIGEINGLAVTRILDGIRDVKPEIRFCQASSSEMYGQPDHSPQTEMSAFRPRNPYGAAKLYAHTMVQSYRERYGLFACSAILFNHESPRRRHSFVTRKVTYGAARIKLGLSTELTLGNIEARRDWGYAPDYVQGMSLMLKRREADDFVFATGETHSVRELCMCAFAHLGLNYLDFITLDGHSYRPDEAFELAGDANKARILLNWHPSVPFGEMIRGMVDADMRALSMQHKWD